MTYPKYEEDFLGWAHFNGKLLREHRFDELDIEHLVEEIENMGESLKRELFNYLSTIVEHLLKIRYAFPNTLERNQIKWKITVKEKMRKSNKLMRKYPHLKNMIDQEFMKEVYEDAVEAVKESNQLYKDIDLSLVPSECPYTFEQCLGNNL